MATRSIKWLHMVQKIADVRIGEQEKVRKLIGRQGQGAFSYARIFPILQISHELLSLGVTASQRDVFYRRVFSSMCTRSCSCQSLLAIGVH